MPPRFAHTLGVVRSFAVFLLLLLVAGCASQSQRPEQPYVYIPPIVITFKSLQKHVGNVSMAVFTMTNVSTEPMWYDGDGRERPASCVQYKGRTYLGYDEADFVSDMSDRYELAPGQSVDFIFVRQFLGPFRVGVWLGLEKDRKTMNDDVWWSDYVNP